MSLRRSLPLLVLLALVATATRMSAQGGGRQGGAAVYRDDIFRLWLAPDGQFTAAQPKETDAQIVIGTFAGVNAILVKTRDVGPARDPSRNIAGFAPVS